VPDTPDDPSVPVQPAPAQFSIYTLLPEYPAPPDEIVVDDFNIWGGLLPSGFSQQPAVRWGITGHSHGGTRQDVALWFPSLEMVDHFVTNGLVAGMASTGITGHSSMPLWIPPKVPTQCTDNMLVHIVDNVVFGEREEDGVVTRACYVDLVGVWMNCG
jgi:hypothetical protein